MKFCVSAFLILFTVLSVLSASEKVSRSIPADILEHKIIEQLTPLEKVIKNANSAIIDDDSGVVLLKEKITWVTASGRRFRVIHYVTQAKTEKGIEPLSRDNFRYDIHLSKVHLITARTVLPDGTIKDLAENAAFLQRGRNETSSQTYHSDRELVIIYPDIKVGSITQTIVIYEDVEPKINNHFLSSISFSTGWPIQKEVNIIDLPKALHNKLTIHKIGSNVPPHTTTAITDDRMRSSWVRHNIPGSYYEPERAPNLQVGPAIRLTTLPNWNEFSTWYNSLLKPRAILSDELKSLVDDWTDGLVKQEDIVNKLFHHVANDVRYTGLEFGNSGLQPYDCNLVWRNQYGDCKDKSNLLAALLRYKNIPAFVTLINTQHRGLISMPAPSHACFDHAILAIPTNKDHTQWLFCDPTISYGEPGMLAPSSSNRDALIICNDQAIWTKTPETPAGEIHYDFQLDLAQDGQLRGWLTMTSSGYYHIGAGERYHGLERHSVIRLLDQIISQYFPGATVSDYEVPSPENHFFTDPAVVKAYFTCAPLQPDEQGRLHLAFPYSDKFIMFYGSSQSRETDFFQWRDIISVSSSISLPKSWNLSSCPSPFDAQTPYYAAKANWAFDEKSRKLQSTWKVEVITETVPAAKIHSVQQINKSMDVWLQKAALLSKEKGLKSHPTSNIDMAVMPSGQGQLDLADKLYPISGDRNLRKLAYEKVIQLYPNDADTVFIARAHLAYLFYYHDDFEQSQAAYSQLLTSSPSTIDPTELHFAYYMQAIVERNLNNLDAAIEILTTLSKQTSLSSFREGWTHTKLGDYYSFENRNINQAITHYKRALEVDDEHLSYTYRKLLLTLIEKGSTEDASKLLTAWIESGLDGFQAELNTLSEELNSHKDLLPLETTYRAVEQTILSLKSTSAAITPLKSFLEPINIRIDYLKNSSFLHTQLTELIQTHKPSYLQNSFDSETYDTQKKVEEFMDESYNEDHQAWFGAATHYFTNFPPNDRFTHYLWLLLGYVEWIEYKTTPATNEHFFSPLVELTKQISHKDENYWECQFTIASWLESQNRWGEAATIYEAMYSDPDWDTDFEISCWNRLGYTHERRGNLTKAIECYTRFADRRADFNSVCEKLLQAGILHLKLNQDAKAIQTWQLLSDVNIDTWKDSDEADDIKSAIDLIKSPNDAIAFWKSTRSWWTLNYLTQLNNQADTLSQDYKNLPYLTKTANDITEKVELAVEEQNIDNFLTALLPVAESSQWLPNRLSDLYNLTVPNISAFSKDELKIIYGIIAHYAETVRVGPKDDIELAKRIECAMHHDMGEHKVAHHKLEKYLDEISDFKTEHFERLTWLYMLNSSPNSGNLQKVTNLGLKAWKNGVQFIDKGAFGLRLAGVLETNKKTKEAIAILKELSPTISDKSSHYQSLQTMLERLQRSELAIANFESAINQWFEKHQPAWYDHIYINSLDDPKLPPLSKLLKGNRSELHDLEYIKALLIAAQTQDIPLADRESAYSTAINKIHSSINDLSLANKVMLDSLSPELLSDSTNARILWPCYIDLASIGKVKFLDQIEAHPCFKLLRDDLLNEVAPDRKAIAHFIQSKDPEKALELARRIAPLKLSENYRSSTLMFLYYQLAGLGYLEEMQILKTEAKQWNFDAAAKPNKLECRLQMTQAIKRTKQILSFTAKLAESSNSLLQSKAPYAPQNWKDFRDPAKHHAFTPNQRDSIKAAQVIEQSGYDVTDLRFWLFTSTFWKYNGTHLNNSLINDALDHLFSSDLDENSKASTLLSIIYSGLIDTTLATNILEKFDKNFGASHSSDTMQTLYILAKQSALYNTSQSIESDQLILHGGSGSLTEIIADFSALSLLIQKNDLKGIQRYLDRADTTSLTNPILIHSVATALKLTKDTDTLELIEEYLVEELSEDLLDAWQTPSISKFISVHETAFLINKPTLIPAAWVFHMMESLSHDDLKIVNVLNAYRSQSWNEVINAAEAYLEDQHYLRDTWLVKYYQAMALTQLKDFKQANSILEELAAINPTATPYSPLAAYQIRENIKRMEN